MNPMFDNVRNDFGLTSDEVSYMSAEIERINAESAAKRACLLATFDGEHGATALDIIKKDLCLVEMSCFDENPVVMARKAGRQEVYFALVEALALAKKEADENGD